MRQPWRSCTVSGLGRSQAMLGSLLPRLTSRPLPLITRMVLARILVLILLFLLLLLLLLPLLLLVLLLLVLLTMMRLRTLGSLPRTAAAGAVAAWPLRVVVVGGAAAVAAAGAGVGVAERGLPYRASAGR